MTAETRRRKTLDWLRYARADLRAAGTLLNAEEGGEPYHVGFWAQQAAEKAIKAALIFSGQALPPSHDLNDLIRELPADWRTRRFGGRLEQLSRYAVETRYPDPRRLPTPDDARQALKDARAVLQSVLRDLQEHGMPLPTRPLAASPPTDDTQ